MSARVNVRRRTRLPWARTRDTAADPTNAPTLTADPPPPSAAHIRAYHSRIDIGSRYWTLRARGPRGSDTRRAPSPPRGGPPRTVLPCLRTERFGAEPRMTSIAGLPPRDGLLGAAEDPGSSGRSLHSPPVDLRGAFHATHPGQTADLAEERPFRVQDFEARLRQGVVKLLGRHVMRLEIAAALEEGGRQEPAERAECRAPPLGRQDRLEGREHPRRAGVVQEERVAAGPEGPPRGRQHLRRPRVPIERVQAHGEVERLSPRHLVAADVDPVEGDVGDVPRPPLLPGDLDQVLHAVEPDDRVALAGQPEGQGPDARGHVQDVGRPGVPPAADGALGVARDLVEELPVGRERGDDRVVAEAVADGDQVLQALPEAEPAHWMKGLVRGGIKVRGDRRRAPGGCRARRQTAASRPVPRAWRACGG